MSQMDFRVLSVVNHNEWKNVLSQVNHFDFYHTPAYSSLEKDGEARLIVFEESGKVIAIPLVFRKILGTDFQDVTSVYGYAGWIRNTEDTFPDLFPALEDYFKKEKIVSAFSRLHPFIPGSDNFERGLVLKSNTTLAIDLSLPEDIQWRSYSESVRRSIKRSRKTGLTVRLAQSEEDIFTFASIYRNAMAALNATPSYFFSDEYFINLLNKTDYESFVLFAEVNGEIAGGALFVCCNEYMQYHFGAVVPAFRSFSPLKLLIDEARQMGNRRRCSMLHLGGGHGGNNDNLYIFKSRMGTLQFPFKVWKWIVDEANYSMLSEEKPKTTYFPLYRT